MEELHKYSYGNPDEIKSIFNEYINRAKSQGFEILDDHNLAPDSQNLVECEIKLAYKDKNAWYIRFYRWIEYGSEVKYLNEVIITQSGIVFA